MGPQSLLIFFAATILRPRCLAYKEASLSVKRVTCSCCPRRLQVAMLSDAKAHAEEQRDEVARRAGTTVPDHPDRKPGLASQKFAEVMTEKYTEIVEELQAQVRCRPPGLQPDQAWCACSLGVVVHR